MSISLFILLATQSKLHKSLQTHAFTEGMLLDAMFRSVDVIKYLYSDFNDRHNPRACLGETKSAEACTPSGRPMMLAEGVEEVCKEQTRRKICMTSAMCHVYLAGHDVLEAKLQNRNRSPGVFCCVDFQPVSAAASSLAIASLNSRHCPCSHVLKTNFYRREKTALSFRMHPGFLPVSKYPDTPFGFFMVIGAEFR